MVEDSRISEVLDRYIINEDGTIYHPRKLNLIKGSVTKAGYRRIYFYLDGSRFKLSVHRVIALKFIPNPENKPQVNHKDGNKLNNRVSNLEWSTTPENIKHAYDFLGKQPNKTGLGKFSKLHSRSKKIIQKDKSGVVVKIWDCAADVKRSLGWSRGNICSCARGLSKSAYGFIWEYEKKPA